MTMSKGAGLIKELLLVKIILIMYTVCLLQLFFDMCGGNRMMFSKYKFNNYKPLHRFTNKRAKVKLLQTQ